MTKKEFIIEQLSPYVLDTDLCAINAKGDMCQYRNDVGKMCVAGKNLLKYDKTFECMDIESILDMSGENILKPEARGILSHTEWQGMQSIHDAIAKGVGEEVIIEKVMVLEERSKENLTELKDLVRKHLAA